MKNTFLYILVFILRIISWLPFWILYRLSDFFFVVLYYLIGYRKKVVYNNLKNAFPEKDEQALKSIERKFYRYLCDVIIETLKIPSISKKQLHKRCKLMTTEHVDYFYEKGQRIIAVMGHHGNWEWTSLAVNVEARQRLFAIYSPLKNKVINNFILKTRERWGTKLISMKDTPKEMEEYKNEISINAFITDQTPSPKNAHWMKFLNQDTPVFLGAEKIARKYNLPVVFTDVRRIKRGYYEVYTEIITESPSDLKEFELTELYTKKLEQEIIRQPETWLWSHRRWKHKKPE